MDVAAGAVEVEEAVRARDCDEGAVEFDFAVGDMVKEGDATVMGRCRGHAWTGCCRDACCPPSALIAVRQARSGQGECMDGG